MKKIDSYIDDTIENIKNDRALALKLLTDVMKSLTTGHDHKDLGQVASKYLETLQRSNEQLVKKIPPNLLVSHRRIKMKYLILFKAGTKNGKNKSYR